MSSWEQMTIGGIGEADTPRTDLFPAATRSTIRYADPAAWVTATAVLHALSEVIDRPPEWPHQVGMIAVNDCGPASTMAEVNAAADAGYSSPLRFAASSPGSLVGVSCIAFGFRGPTLNLTMLPEEGVPVALTACSAWLSRGVARCMVVASLTVREPGVWSARALVLAAAGKEIGCGTPLTLERTEWLLHRRAVGPGNSQIAAR